MKRSCWGFWRRYNCFQSSYESKHFDGWNKAHSCDTTASTFVCLFPLGFFFLSFKPIFCYHAACTMDGLPLSHPDFWPSHLSIPKFSPAPALLVSNKSTSDLGRRGGCQMSLTRTVFPCHGAEAGRADDQRLVVVYLKLLALNLGGLQSVIKCLPQLSLSLSAVSIGDLFLFLPRKVLRVKTACNLGRFDMCTNPRISRHW